MVGSIDSGSSSEGSALIEGACSYSSGPPTRSVADNALARKVGDKLPTAFTMTRAIGAVTYCTGSVVISTTLVETKCLSQFYLHWSIFGSTHVDPLHV